MRLHFFLGRCNLFTIPILAHLAERENVSYTTFASESLPTEVGHDDVAVFSLLTAEVPHAHALMRILRARHPRLRFVAGGPHVDGNPEFALRTLELDLAVKGSAVPGWVGLVSEALHRGLRVLEMPPLASLDELEPLAVHHRFRPPLELRRGCANRCAFCKTGTERRTLYRSRESIERCLRDMCNHDLKRLAFVTPSAFAASPGDDEQRDAFLEWLFSLARKLGFSNIQWGIFPSEADPRSVTARRLRLVAAHCRNRKLTIGCQTGSETLLKKLCRGHDLEEVERACAISAENGFQPLVDFILGFPDETDDDREATLRLMRKLGARWGARSQLHFFMPLPGTPLGNRMPSSFSGDFERWIGNEEKAGRVGGAWREHLATVRAVLPYLDVREARIGP